MHFVFLLFKFVEHLGIERQLLIIQSFLIACELDLSHHFPNIVDGILIDRVVIHLVRHQQDL